MAKDEGPVAFGQKLLRLRHEIEARIRVMCPHPLGSRAERAWVAWAKGIVFGCVVTQASDTGPGADLGTEVCEEKFRPSGPRRGGVLVCKDPTDAHGSRAEQAARKKMFAEDSRKWKVKKGSKE